jgi:hypothetical protein
MTNRSMQQFDDTALEGALRSLGDGIVWPTAAPTAAGDATTGPDIATRVRVRLTDTSRPRARRGWLPRGWRPVRRSLLLALIALLALAIVAGAAGLWLPGLRLSFGGGPTPPTPAPTVRPGASPTPSPLAPSAPGAGLRLGQLTTLDQVEATTGIPVRLPADARLGPPDAVWIDPPRGNQLAYVWGSRPDLPATNEPGIGLVLMRFDGTTDPGFYQKVIGSGTHIEAVDVAGHDGFWITGDPHFFFYTRDGQQFFEEDRRWVGDALIWSDGTTTFRIESGLNRDATIAIAESIE